MSQHSSPDATLTDELEALGASIDPPFEQLALPMLLLDRNGRVRWQNGAAVELFGDRRRASFAALVAPDYRPAVQQVLSRGMLGLGSATDEKQFVILGPNRERRMVSAKCVPLRDGEQVVGELKFVFPIAAPSPRPVGEELPPRLHEALRLLADGRSTNEIARSMSVTRETARGYIRRLLKRLDVHSRLEAVVRGRERGLV